MLYRDCIRQVELALRSVQGRLWLFGPRLDCALGQRSSLHQITLMQLLTRFLGIAVVLGALAARIGAQAQPANDAFANAWTMTGALVFTNGSSLGASKETGEPNHAGNPGGRSVWFNWTAPKSGQIRVHTIGSAFNTLLAVYTGSAVNALTQIAANNDGPGIGGASLVEFIASQGTTYRVVVDASRNFGTPNGGNYALSIETLATVNITSPTNNAVVYVGNPIEIAVEVDVASPPVNRVDFYRGAALAGTDLTFPYLLSVTNAPLGTNTYFAVAVDNNGVGWTSAVVRVAYLNLGATILTPLDGTILQTTNPIFVAAVTSLPGGSITNVDFAVDDQKLAQDATSPFSTFLSGVLGGVHRLTAIARDGSGNVYTSSPVNISVPMMLVATGAVWKYLDNGSDQGTNWVARIFNDAGWASGRAQLGYGDGDETTVVSFGPDLDPKYITTYFRHSFVLTGATNYTNLLVNVKRDDGAVVYLNGVEVQRFNMPTGAISHLTRASTAIDDGTTFIPAGAPGTLLVEGTNTVAVEIHQDLPDDDDISFDFQLQGVPFPRNRPPVATILSPPNLAALLAPTSVLVTAGASDPNGRVTRVAIFVDGVLLGEVAAEPYAVSWNNPPIGRHILRVVATDDLGTSASSDESVVFIYDAAGTPLSRITAPADGAIVEGPTNLLVTVEASALGGLERVQFLANGIAFADDPVLPFSAPWNAPFGSNVLTAVAISSDGKRGTSAPVSITVTIPPTNTVGASVVARTPPSGASLSTLTFIRVVFSERVVGVDAADLLVNGVPATQVTGTTSNYLFTVVQPIAGTVNITWAADHGITDVGYPENLPFDETAPGATWTYNLLDIAPPTVLSVSPPAGITVTNLTQITVNFNEPVNGVEAGDFLVNGAPAYGLNSAGNSYTFSFSQPPSGLVNITWASGHAITDFGIPPNAFNANGAGATWSYLLDSRTILMQSNSVWRFIKGQAEASAPIDAWRQPDFNDSSWSNAAAPFYFGDTGYASAANPGTQLTDMLGNYTSIYLRRQFQVPNAGAVTNLFLNTQIDDGVVAWINGIEVVRTNLPSGDVPYNGVATASANEPTGNGAAYLAYTLPNPGGYLQDGTNLLVVHAFNQSLSNSTDFGFNAQLYTFMTDPSLVAPRITSVNPGAGTVFYLTNLTVRFLEPVTGVDAGDLLVNGIPATGVSGGSSNATYVFSFPAPQFGLVSVTWATGHGIVDFDSPPKPFNGAAPGSTFQYTFLNPSTPTVVSQIPSPGGTLSSLTQISVTFSEPVVGVNAADFLINGATATGVTGSGANYTFTFPQPDYGPVSIGWVVGHGIVDLDVPSNAFDVTRQGSTWAYTLVDQTAPVIVAVNPPAGSQVTNLTQVIVTFSEPVTGVGASDLRVNGVPASTVAGGPSGYTFSFPQPNATVVSFSWLPAHGIRDLAPVPNSFDATAPGAVWSYATPDNVAPTVASIEPPPFVTVRSLTSIRVTFAEPVTGVDTNDLFIGGRRALAVNGSGAGPYSFSFLPPPSGSVEVQWAAPNGIADLATPVPNPFGGGQWNYTLDPSATFVGKVLVNEIMFNPIGGLPSEEWLELRNVTAAPINLAGWRFTRGVNFSFPNVSIPANGYLVVAASLESFQSSHPAVANVVGGWTGRLANSDETIELESALGEIVDTVDYATEGDWARRERGRGAEPVNSIVRNGTTATVNIFGHGYANNDVVIISGAEQPEYNGRFTIGNISSSTFTIQVLNTAETPASGFILCRQATHMGNSGWAWFSAADGFGNSLELVSPALGNDSGQSWLPSSGIGGTPGAANSVAAGNVAPLILDATHSPAVPTSSEAVAITARVKDELPGGIAAVTLFFRNHTTPGPGSFISTNMFDDGGHGDGLGNDGLFGAMLPAAPNGTIIEFYVRASDATGNQRTWPAPTWETNNTFGQLANALYQVDDEVISNPMPAFRVIMTGTEDAVFPTPNRNSDAEVNSTFISIDGDGTKIRYLSGVRIRGAGSRSQQVPNNRVNIANDNRWNGLAALNLNSQYVHSQIMGAAVARKSGLPASDARIIQYRINGVNPSPVTAPGGGGAGGAGYGSFILVQPVNGDLAANLFPDDGDGNVYRASVGNHTAQLNYLGTNPDTYLATGYFKTSNGTENDWTDLFNLTFAFSQTNAPLSDYLTAMGTNVNVEFWMRYFALGTLVNFGETSMFNGRGDDYAMYRGVRDPRFVPIGHDFDTIFGQGDTTGTYTTSTNSSIYIMLNPPNTGGGGGFGGNPPNMPVLRRFLTNEVFAPVFFSELKRLADTVFHPSQLNPLFDQILSDWGNGPTTVTIDTMKTFANNRRSVVLSQIPLTLTVSNALGTQSGFLYTATPSATLFGTSHAIDTRKVLVNGVAAARAPWEGRWTNTVALLPGINRVLVQSLDSNNVEFARATVDIWYDDGAVQPVSGAITGDAVWTAVSGPYQVTANLTVNAGVTLTIQAGTAVYISPGVNITVANGGRILAEGTDTARIRFSSAPGAGNWGGLTINGGPNSPESRIAYTHFDGNGDTAIEVADGTAFLDHLTFGNTSRQYLSLDRASFVVQNCVFPTITGSFEPVHGTGGIKTGGRGIVLRNFWGKISGYNDAFDFTGGNRPGPILQVINNVFLGSDDDLLDFDSTDAWVEGNIFLHTHRNGSPDSASAISGGADNADTSQITIVGNLFYDVDHAANAKQGNFYTMVNNTIVHQTKIGSQDTNTAVVILADMNEQGTFTAQGSGIFLEGNIIYDAENLTRHVTTALVTFTNNLIHQLAGTAWSGPGGGNTTADPLLKRIPPFSETTAFNSWAAAQVMWDYFSLQTGSPAAGAGPNRRNQGGVIPIGISVEGEPPEITSLNTATLTVGVNHTDGGVPVAGFPNGSGFTHYRWRLDGGAWSAETPATSPINLTSLGNGPHFVEVSGRRDSGYYQDDPAFGSDAVITTSRTWTVDTSVSPLRLNEVLAANSGALIHVGTTPDAIELFNEGSTALNLAGVRLSDDLTNPDKFIFPVGSSIPARGYLTVFANNPDGTPGIHLGFSLAQQGDTIYLFDSPSRGGELLDSLSFGLQLTDLSIGRLANGTWTLTQPTFGAANKSARQGDPAALRINEWLAIGTTPFNDDFIELYNTGALPVSLAGLFITDEITGDPDRHAFAPLSYVGGFAYQRLIADGEASAGADHVSFNLNGDQGEIGLFDSKLGAIDLIYYQAQRLNFSQGRSPNGGSAIVFLDTPTPGSPNPLITVTPQGGALVVNEVLANNASIAEAGRTPDWVELYNGTANSVDLSGMSLTDDTLQPRRFVFAPGTTLASAARLRVICDTGGTPGPGPLVNTNFALKSAGGGVYLFDTLVNGGSLLNSIVYGLQTPDLTIGRVPDGSTNWVLNTPTPDAENAAVPVLGNVASLKVNEWLANPPAGSDDWIEIYNPGPLPVALGGLWLTDNIGTPKKHPIAPLSFLGTGTNAWQRFIADNNTGAGADHLSFRLDALDEDVGISTVAGILINGYAYFAEQEGVSEGRFPDGAETIVRFPGTASPGESNWRRLTNVVINEVLTHSDTPLEDAIELRNLTGQPIDVGGWWLSDDDGTLRKYQIPSPTVIPANGYTVIYETAFTNDALAAIPFALSSKGDEVVLSAAAGNAFTGFRARQDFGAQLNGVSFGRYVTSDNREELVAMSAHTFGVDDPGSVEEFRSGTGAANPYPRIGPVVISEIMYHPPDQGINDNTADEFVELHNITTAPVPLYDPANPQHVWRLRDAVDFDFAPGTVIAAGDYLLVVSFDPINNTNALAAFRTRYQVASTTAIVGPYSGKLANDTDDLELRRPDAPNEGEVPSVLVERVRYSDLAPWPVEADGTGLSLQRVVDLEFGNDPVNWIAGAPTPGPAAFSLDTDNDGLPNWWEIQYNFDPFNGLDAGLDSDSDGLTNLQEYQMGSDPRDRQSGISLIALSANGPNIVLRFTAFANQSYTVESAAAINGPWTAFEDVAVAAAARNIEFTVPVIGTARFFRLRTPWRFAEQASLRISSVQTASGGQVTLGFEVPAGQACAVEHRASLGSGNWNLVTNIPSASVTRSLQVNVSAGASSGFYRLRSP